MEMKIGDVINVKCVEGSCGESCILYDSSCTADNIFGECRKKYRTDGNTAIFIAVDENGNAVK